MNSTNSIYHLLLYNLYFWDNSFDLLSPRIASSCDRLLEYGGWLRLVDPEERRGEFSLLTLLPKSMLGHWWQKQTHDKKSLPKICMLVTREEQEERWNRPLFDVYCSMYDAMNINPPQYFWGTEIKMAASGCHWGEIDPPLPKAPGLHIEITEPKAAEYEVPRLHQPSSEHFPPKDE